MKPLHLVLAATATATALLLLACGATRPKEPAAAAVASMAATPNAGASAPGYLAPGALDLIKVLPAAPVAGEARYESDRSIFRATRRFDGSARWAMASDDALLGTADVLRHFSCAMDLKLEPATARRTVRLLQRASRDAGQAMNTAKEYYRRQRPFWIDEGRICRPREELGQTFDYPSGHTMVGWTWGLVLSQLMPDRTADLLARGRSIGESRIVCGVHNASAVDAGRVAATAVVSLLGSKSEFRQDLDAAREEIDALRRTGSPPDPKACAVEQALIAEPIG